MCWKKNPTCNSNSPSVRALESADLQWPPSGLHQNATAAIEEALSLYLSRSLSSVRQQQPIAMATEADVEGFLLCDEMWTIDLFYKKKKKERENGSNGYGFMSVWAGATLPLRQLGTPYATAWNFYDVGLCRGWTIYFAHGLWGFAHMQRELYLNVCM